jgi:hypothetical protein
MNEQAREFFQKALRTLGSPFKIRRVRNARRSIEDALESQTGILEWERKDEAQFIPSAQHSALIPNTPQILPQDCIASKSIPPSETSTRHAASEEFQEHIQAKSDARDGSLLTEGSSRILLVNDGTKDCLALLLTKKLIYEFNYLSQEARTLKTAERNLEEVDLKASMAELEVRAIQKDIERTEDPDLKTKLSNDIEFQTQVHLENTARKESLRLEVMARRLNLECSQNVFQNIFRGALEETDLLTPFKAETKSDSPARSVEGRAESITSSKADDSVVSVEELFRRTAYQDMELTREVLDLRQSAFDNRQVDYERELGSFHVAVANRATSCTQSLFDCLAVRTIQRQTRALINAEADYESAVARAKALGIIANTDDQESNFISDISDGYHESQEALMRSAVDRNFIECWADTIVSSQPVEPEEPQEPDDWEAKTIGMSDSVSVVDYSRNRKRIARWREMCGL